MVAPMVCKRGIAADLERRKLCLYGRNKTGCQLCVRCGLQAITLLHLLVGADEHGDL